MRQVYKVISKEISHRHHYIPQFYLREWRGDDGVGVWLYKRNSANQITYRRRSPKSVGYVNDLYSLKSEIKWCISSHDADAIERNFFSPIDDAAAIVHQKLITSGCKSLSSQDRIDWALFLNSLIERNPKRISEIVQSSSIERIKQEFIKRWGGSTHLDGLDIDAIHHNAGRNCLVHYIADKPFVNYIANMRWAIVHHSIDGEHFLTGDMPILVNGDMAENPIHLLSIALSPNKLMILHTDSEEFNEYSLRVITIIHNIGIVDSAQKYLISSKELKDGPHTKFNRVIEERFNKPQVI